jgi:riboflavin synthase
MFTGLVQQLGTLTSLDGGRLEVETTLGAELAPGDSVAVNGACLTATTASPEGFTADVMEETLRRTALGDLSAGDPVNLELALRAADRLGGHFVQGHVDAVGTVASIQDEGFAKLVEIEAPDRDAGLLRYVVEKGSIAVDGVSLTVASLGEGTFVVSLIPETLERTTLGRASPGDSVNLEVDVLAKYVERLVASTGATAR